MGRPQGREIAGRLLHWHGQPGTPPGRTGARLAPAHRVPEVPPGDALKSRLRGAVREHVPRGPLL
eukprot:11206501-Lingulodinium_polyedra.AAC.1